MLRACCRLVGAFTPAQDKRIFSLWVDLASVHRKGHFIQPGPYLSQQQHKSIHQQMAASPQALQRRVGTAISPVPASKGGLALN